MLLHVGRARSYPYLHFVHGSGLIYWPSDAGRGLKLVRCHMSRDILFCSSRTVRLPAYFAQNHHSGARHDLFINAPYLEEFLHALLYRCSAVLPRKFYIHGVFVNIELMSMF